MIAHRLKRPDNVFHRQAIEDGGFFKAGSARLIDTVTDEGEFARAVGIGRNRDLNARRGGGARMIRRKIQAIRTRIDQCFRKACGPLLLPVDRLLLCRDFLLG